MHRVGVCSKNGLTWHQKKESSKQESRDFFFLQLKNISYVNRQFVK